MLRLEDFSDGEDDTLEEEEDTALQDLLTCSALNVEAKVSIVWRVVLCCS